MTNLEPVLSGDDTIRRNFSKLEEFYALLEDLTADLDTLNTLVLTALGANRRIVAGTINTAGAVARGTGFSSARNAAGDFTITFTTAFTQIPTVVVSTGETAGALVAKLKGGVAPTTSAFTVNTFRTTDGAAIDSIVSFVAIGQ